MANDGGGAERETLVAHLRDQVGFNWTAVTEVERALGRPVGHLLAGIPGVVFDGGKVRYTPATQTDLETAIETLVQNYEDQLRDEWPGDVLAEYREQVDGCCTSLMDLQGVRYEWIDDEAVEVPAS